jgi:hypothetical protein
VILLGGGLLFLVVLDDGLGGGVVDGELLGDLSDNRWGYVDDAHSFLNIAKELFPHLLPHFFVTLRSKAVLHEQGLDLVAEKGDLGPKAEVLWDFLKLRSHA